MKTLVTLNSTTPTGYELRVIHDDGIIDVFPIVKSGLEKKSGVTWLVLPENPTNRKLLNVAKMEGKTEYELTEKAPRVSTPKSAPKALEDYLEGEDKALYLELVAKAMANKEKSKEDERLNAKIAKKEAELEELKKQHQEKYGKTQA